jgi:hypothetical protein
MISWHDILRFEYDFVNAICNTDYLQKDSETLELSIKVQKYVNHLNTHMASVGVLPAVLAYGTNCYHIG